MAYKTEEVEKAIKDVSTADNMSKAMQDFSREFTKMHHNLQDMADQSIIMQSQVHEIAAQYLESFIYAAVRTVEKHRRHNESR